MFILSSFYPALHGTVLKLYASDLILKTYPSGQCGTRPLAILKTAELPNVVTTNIRQTRRFEFCAVR
ncbi:MAG: hypothetical protein ABW206_01140 [Agrobacterium vaccinii]